MKKTIKRYQNRKLYDTEESTYVTLTEITQMVKSGLEVEVIDNNSKADITQSVLFECVRKLNAINSDNLRSIIVNSI